jgi:two-component system, NtrC family, sensor kinase
MSPWSGTARRLLLAFAALIALYFASSLVAIAGFSAIDDGLSATRRLAEGMRLSLELSSAVRDQYAHQAHTIILANESHLGFYGKAEARVLELTRQVRALLASEEKLLPDAAQARAELDEIEAASAQLDGIFRKRIVPAVVAQDRAVVQEQHALAQEQVSLIQERTDAIAQRFEEAIGRLQSQVSAAERRARFSMVLFLLGAPLLALLVFLWVGRSVAVPVARLHAGAARLAAGDLEARIEIDTPDEFGQLARQFNAMTLALKEHQARLVETEKLAGIGRLAAGVAHEINNPLGVILGYTRLLRKGAAGAGEAAEGLSIIEEETLRCQEIVEGLLDLSRPLSLTPQPVDLRELCEEVIARLSESKQLSGVAVRLEGEALARGHPRRLRQVALNLIKNAVEASLAGPRREVLVRLSVQGAQAELAVADGGPGIAASARGKLFEPFFTTKPQGTGLGLAVSRAIARAHGGDITAGEAASVAAGPIAASEGREAEKLGGALFCLRLPAEGDAGTTSAEVRA